MRSTNRSSKPKDHAADPLIAYLNSLTEQTLTSQFVPVDPAPLRPGTSSQPALIKGLEAMTQAGRDIGAALAPSAIYEAVELAALSLFEDSECRVIRTDDGSRADATLHASCRRNEPDTAGPGSALCTPISLRGEITACIHLKRIKSDEPFSPIDVQVAAFLSGLAEAALENCHDPLTGLANRNLFAERVGMALARCSDTGVTLALISLDLDDFRAANDTFGRAAGDSLLAGVAERLRKLAGPNATVARLGGDGFAVLVEDLDTSSAEGMATQMLSEMNRPFRILERDVHARASMGIAISAAHGHHTPSGISGRADSFGTNVEAAENLLSEADTAMYVAKTHGKGRFEVFKPYMRANAVERSNLRTDLEWALSRQELEVHYQPVVNVHSGVVVGFEALLRWHHPERGLLAPDEFIDLAEDTHLIISIGAWTLRQACRQATTWRRSQRRDLTMAVNVSSIQLQDAGLVGEIATALREAQLDPSALVLEITESAMVADADGAIARLGELKALGVSLAIDDFGTGYSSLSYLRRLPVDQLKVDRSFVAGVAVNPEDVAILASVVSLSQVLGISVVAEGVETMDQLEKLSEMGCDLAQGFNWLHPCDVATVDAWLDHVFGPADPISTDQDVRVLLADDRDGLRAMLRIALEVEKGFAVVAEAANTPETIRLAELHQPDLIVLDVAMPGTSGIAALPYLRQVAPKATIVLLTALDLAAVVAEGGDAADGVIDKTRDLSEFLDQLGNIVRR